MKSLLQNVRVAYEWRDPDALEHALLQIEQLFKFFGYAMKATPKSTVESIARVCHEINRQYCASLGDYSQQPWDAAPAWQRASVLAGVEMHLNNPDATPEDSHKSWMAVKEAEGWVYGPEKDADKRTHPCMAPYSELSQEQRSKDFIFRGTIHAIAHEMVRKP